MIYTEGVTKIFRNMQGYDLDECQDKAYKSGYEAMSFNGDIWVLSGNSYIWVRTCLRLQDFTVNL